MTKRFTKRTTAKPVDAATAAQLKTNARLRERANRSLRKRRKIKSGQ